MEFSKKTVNENMFLKLVLSVEGVDAMETYRKLGDYRARTKWDFLSKYVMEPIKAVLSASHCAQLGKFFFFIGIVANFQ